MTTNELIDFEGSDVIRERMIKRAISANLPGISEGQTLRNLCSLFANELQSQHNKTMYAMANSTPLNASGPYLDMIGESIFGIVRHGAISANTTEADRNIIFSVTNGPLSDYLTTSSNGRPYIPQDTVITDGNGNDYKISSNIYVSQTATEVFVPARATISGRSRNVPANALTMHSIDTRIQCTNRYDISNGQDVESDQNYRYRVMNAHLASQSGNRASIENAIAGVPGISRFTVNENFNGPGTVEIILVPIGNKLPPSTKRSAQIAVQSVSPASSIIIVREPLYVEYEMALTMSRRNKINNTASMIRNNTISALSTYFNAVPMGGQLDTNSMIATLLGGLSQYGVADIKITCFLLNQQAIKPGIVKLAKKDLLVPSSFVAEPIKVLVA